MALPRDRRHLMEILRPSTRTNEAHEAIDDMAVWKQTYVRYLSDSEIVTHGLDAHQLGTDRAVAMESAYVEGLASGMWLRNRAGTRLFEIVGITDVNERHESILITCRETVPLAAGGPV